MGQIHIIRKSNALPLVPCRTIGVIIINRNLPCMISHGYRKLPSRIIISDQHIRNCLCSGFRRIPRFQYGVQIFIRRIAGNRSSVKMNAHQRLPKLCRFSDKCVLAWRKINISGIHALSHRSHGTCAMLSAQRQDHYVRFRRCLKRLLKM